MRRVVFFVLGTFVDLAYAGYRGLNLGVGAIQPQLIRIELKQKLV